MESAALKRRKMSPHEEGIENEESIYSEKKGSVGEPRFFSWEVIQILLVHTIAGAFFGYSVGFVGPYYTFFKMSRECPLFTSEETCTSLQHAKCRWSSGRCEYSITCVDFTCNSQCVSKNCIWDEKHAVCENQVGYTGVENGIFAGSLIVGACVGSLGAASLLAAVGIKRSFIISGVVACIGAVFIHVSTHNDNFALLNIGRVFAGLATGVLCCVSPMYVEDMVPLPYRQSVGVFFQIACTVGILLAAVIAVALNPRDISNVLNMEARRQGFCVPSTLLSILVVIAGIFMNESPRSHKGLGGTSENKEDQPNPLGASVPVPDPLAPAVAVHVPFKYMIRPLTIAAVLCIAQQMTGICAVMNYAPNITSVMGFEPLTGNLVVMAWNFTSVLISIPISFKFRADYSYIAAVFLSSLSCLLAGIVILPQLGIPETVKRALLGVGIATFIGVFEIGMGSFFWSLSQNIFPTAFRARGSSTTILFQFILNIIVNVAFPIAVENLSGGPSGVQEQGMGIAFLFFGCVGILSGLYLLKNLRLWEHGHEPLCFERLNEATSD